MKNKIIELIYKAIDELNSQNAPDMQLLKTEDTQFIGGDSVLDSMGLINLIVSLEQLIKDEFNIEVTLADERAMIAGISPFRTVSTTAEFIEKMIGKSKNK